MSRPSTTRLFALLTVSLAACSTFSERDRAIEDERAIRAKLRQHYFRGMETLAFEDFAPAFHPQARLAFVADERLVLLDLAQWRARLAALRSDADHPLLHETSRPSIRALHVRGDTAQAVVQFAFPSRTYTDDLQLVRVDDTWLIIHKTFDLELHS